MATPAAEAGIHIAADGGTQAAKELDKVTKAQGGIAKGQKGVQQEFARGIQTTGLISLGREMTLATGLSGSMTTGIVGLITVMKAAMTGAGGLAVTLSILAAVLGAAWAAWAALTKKTEDTAKAMKEANDKLVDQIRLFEEAEKGGIKLTVAQEKLAAALKEHKKYQTEQAMTTMKAAATQKELDAITTSFTEKLKIAQSEWIGFSSATRDAAAANKEASVEAAQLRADIEALGGGFKDNTDKLQESGKEVGAVTKAFKGMRDEIIKSEEALRGLDPAESFAIATAQIERDVAKQIKMLDDLLGKGHKRYTKAVILVHQAASNKVALAWEKEAKRMADANKKAADESRTSWEKETASMQQVTEAFANNFLDSIRTGTVDAAAAFKQLGDAVIAEVQRMAVKAAMARIFQSLAGGAGGGEGGGGGGGLMGSLLAIVSGAASLAGGGGGQMMGGGMGGGQMMLQHGGEIPPPMGKARVAIVHGGERVTSREGRGGPTTAQPPKVYNITFKQGILTADSVRQGMRSIGGMIGSAGDRAFPT